MANFGEFQEQGFDLTEKEIKRQQDRALAAFRSAQKEIEARLEKTYATLAGISPENRGYYNELLKRDRYSILLQDVKDIFQKWSKQSDEAVVMASKIGITNNYYRQLYSSSWGPTVAFAAIPEEVVNLAVFGSETAWKEYKKSLEKVWGTAGLYQPKEGTLSSFLINNRRDQLDKIQEEITAGLMQGSSINQMTNAIRDVTGQTIIKDGKKTVTGAQASAARIIRTETTRTMNAGAFAQSMQLISQGIEVKKMWLATLDSRTRARHASLDGKKIQVDEKFRIGSDSAKYPGDFGKIGNNVNCRCTIIDIIPDFEPDVRTGRNPTNGKNQVFSWLTYDEWMKQNGLRRSKSGRVVPTA